MPGPTVPTAEQVAYIMEYTNDDIGPNIIAYAIIYTVFTIIFVGFRLWLRRIHYKYIRLKTSNWLYIFAWARGPIRKILAELILTTNSFITYPIMLSSV
jgi:hypothetical protein